MVHQRFQKHCINVSQIFDWIYKPICTEVKKSIDENFFILIDQICGNINVSCGEQVLIWKGSENLSISGSVTVARFSGCEQMEVIVNGATTFYVTDNQKTMSFNELNSVEIRCTGNNGTISCFGRYWITLYYKFYKYFDPKHCTISCYLSDEEGNPTDELTCHKIKSKDVGCILPNGQSVVLQKTKFNIKGYLTVKIINDEGKVTYFTLPFQFCETCFLSIPPQSIMECKTTKTNCKAYFSEDGKFLHLCICLCLEMFVLKKRTIAVESVFCQPRADIFI